MTMQSFDVPTPVTHTHKVLRDKIQYKWRIKAGVRLFVVSSFLWINGNQRLAGVTGRASDRFLRFVLQLHSGVVCASRGVNLIDGRS